MPHGTGSERRGEKGKKEERKHGEGAGKESKEGLSSKSRIHRLQGISLYRLGGAGGDRRRERCHLYTKEGGEAARYAARAFRGKGGKGEKPDDEVRVEKRAERVFTGDTRFESFANTPAMKMERRSRIRNWKSNEHFQCSISIDGIETLIRLICRKARVFPTFDWKRTNEKVKKVSRGE